jgi:hypothetical protein
MKFLLFSFFVLTTIFFSSCAEQAAENMSSKEDVKISKALPIDGMYEMYSDLGEDLKKVFGVLQPKQKVKFEKGIAYYTSTSFWDESMPEGKVFLKDIKKINSAKYKGLYYPIHSPIINDTSFNVTILVDGNNLKINLPPLGPLKVSATFKFDLVE